MDQEGRARLMKRITAIIRAEKIREVEDALRRAGAKGFTFYDVRGHGREVEQKVKVVPLDPMGDAAIVDIVADVLPRINYEIISDDATADRICDAIRQASISGSRGDGIIYVESVEQVICILSGERDEKA